MTRTGTGHLTGAKDKDYDLIWFAGACPDNVLGLEACVQDAGRPGGNRLAGLFCKAQAGRRGGVRIGNELLRTLLRRIRGLVGLPERPPALAGGRRVLFPAGRKIRIVAGASS